ncbi:MAG: helix-turn-helix transcriptional regulator [Verrucomicrobia bacterium]|nr:helix-turn-helix transcriptional regulator [Verrucomicrobiota bacterium]MBU1734302.1 helix-turn-helix transcriptional regulator [Verrucomicrobiota bacterium]MBU1857023.1 helix-turn-helix transcriptional regulator [Verrucomicrobiota bacterium]
MYFEEYVMYFYAMKHDLSQLEQVRKLTMDLSADHPIQVCAHVHRQSSGYQSDMHYGLELGLVLSGCMRRYYRDGQQTVKPGAVWFCGMWEPHGCEIVAAPCKVVVFVIWPPILAQMQLEEQPEINWMAPFITSHAKRPQTAPALRKAMLTIGKRLSSVTADPPPMAGAWLRVLLMESLLMLIASWKAPQALPPVSISDPMEKVNRALQLVFTGHRRISIRTAAQACGTNIKTFNAVFTRWMGIHFSEFALRYRINAAASQLKTTDASIKAVALQWGFVDTSHFNRCFNWYYGCAPSNYRQQRTATRRQT